MSKDAVWKWFNCKRYNQDDVILHDNTREDDFDEDGLKPFNLDSCCYDIIN